MKRFLFNDVGRLRLLGFIEGVSLLFLIVVAVPLKHFAGMPQLVKILGPIHGAFFLLFVFGAIRVGVEYGWSFAKTTSKVIVSCFVPFGTFYIDKKVLRPMHKAQRELPEEPRQDDGMDRPVVVSYPSQADKERREAK